MFSDISAQAQENFSAARLVRAFAQEEAQIKAFDTSNREYVRRGLRLVQLMGMLWPTLEFMLGIAMVIVLLVGGHQVLSHRITPGQFTSFTIYTVMLTWPMIAIGWVVNLFERGTASVTRIHELLVEEPSIDDRDADTKQRHAIEGEIEFRHLSFSYGGVEVLRDISLRIPAGSSLALVGLTGAGKTTLVNLIPRLYDAPAGTVLIDGRPVRDYSLEELRRSIGFVPQETFLFSETIRENILFGAPDAGIEEMLDAAQAAHIRKEFEEFPRGFETMVGERGLTLSGGQKQRSSLARALVINPRILILDDALASVDTYTEERILDELRRRTEGRTTILISHRVSTVRNADRIAVLANGRIEELGTHEELLTKEGYYFSLYEKQKMEEELAEVG
jgi:ATP-binding cassette, subfamily B, multidrug efflux pump